MSLRDIPTDDLVRELARRAEEVPGERARAKATAGGAVVLAWRGTPTQEDLAYAAEELGNVGWGEEDGS